MARGTNQKLKLLYLTKMMMAVTDDEHGVSTPDIIARLAANDISVDRKTLYTDFEELRKFGIDIVGEQTGKGYLYHVASRDFELAELKLLVDSVQAAKFITSKKSRELIKKLEGLASVHEAKQLHRQVLISGRVKSMNESIYYNVDKIHTAINENSQIRFQYFQWTVDKKQELRHDGAWYSVSPWHLIWDDEYYYLVAYDSESGIIKHYRVDKMLKINITDQTREGQEAISNSNVAVYSKTLFGMFSGEKVSVTLEAENEYVGILIDRFGRDIIISKVDDEHFRTRVDVVPSDIFICWIMSLGDGIRIIGPAEVIEDTKQLVKRLKDTYL